MRHLSSARTALVAVAALALAAGPALAKNNKKKSVEIANLNLLHGFACDPPEPDQGDQCRVAERVDLLVEHILDVGCPDLVTLQENVVNEFVQRSSTETVGPLDSTVALIAARLPDLAEECGFDYEVVFDPEGATPGAPRGIDEELILTRYPALHAEVAIFYSPLDPFFNRHVLYAQVDHPIGPVDVFTTHLASGADLANFPCGINVLPPPFASPPCPAACDSSGTVRQCQAVQLAAFIESRHVGPEPAFVTGDFNAQPGSVEYDEFAGRGWVDSHLAAGNPECEPTTGVGCTSGRDEVGSDLESPDLNVDVRIDYIFVIPPGEGSSCTGTLQDPDPKHGVTGTGIFAGEPNPFEPFCGAAPLPICWTSDHSGNMANLSCQKKKEAGDGDDDDD